MSRQSPLKLSQTWRNHPSTHCDPTELSPPLQATLNYTCTCSNGTAPGLEYYEQTLPTFICNQAFEDCIAANVGNARGQTNCTDSIKSQCGTIDAQADSAASSTTTSAAATGTGSGSTTGTGTGSQASQTPASSSSSGYAAPTAAPRYGNAAAVAAIGLFAYML